MAMSPIPMKTKACKKCGEVKTLDQFYVTYAGTRDGHMGSCMVCDRAKARVNRLLREERARVRNEVDDLQRSRAKTDMGRKT